ncbi:unnamed protein product [Nezara viridula]|uniref:PDZ domain-containing protein n=1 Tax=Nezara viridula TaxID=85310 RepID=A0A9P0EEW2_NEZVI|nr:unnamed protein product [Nezara viridula]
MSEEKQYAESLRLCQIFKCDNFDGYGFNLYAEKTKPGQYIGKVDEGSPAEAAGLKEGDRIIEVNAVNIANENHKQVVQRIKALPHVTTLLVIDAAGDEYYRTKNIVLKSSLPFVVHLQNSPDPSKIGFNEMKNSEDTQSQKSTKSAQSSENENMQTSLDNSPSEEINQNDDINPNDLNNQNNSLNLNMTAKELRAQLAAKKKYDPKKDQTIDFKKKYDIVQKL